MKKLLTAIGFVSGAIFTMMFSTKRGEDVRKKMKTQKTTEAKAEVVAEEAKEMAMNFWNTVKGPLNKASVAIQKDMKKYADQYGNEAKGKIDEWKKQAEKEIKKDMQIAKKEIKKAAKKTTSIAKKKVKAVKKQVSKGAKK